MLRLQEPGISGCGKNPILVAEALKRALEADRIGTRDSLAAQIGMDAPRVGRFLKLLELVPDIQQKVRELGAMLGRPRITETDLRPIARLAGEEQQRQAMATLLRRKGLSLPEADGGR